MKLLFIYGSPARDLATAFRISIGIHITIVLMVLSQLDRAEMRHQQFIDGIRTVIVDGLI
jgi:hypothetical protein